jgi:hypothetical protein
LHQGLGGLDLGIAADAGQRPSTSSTRRRRRCPSGPSTELNRSESPQNRALSATRSAGTPSKKSITRAWGTAAVAAVPGRVCLVRAGAGAQATASKRNPPSHRPMRIETFLLELLLVGSTPVVAGDWRTGLFFTIPEPW